MTESYENGIFFDLLDLLKVNSFPGKLISLDTLDGGGNSTQAQLLEEYLRNHGFPTILTKEPTAEFVGQAIRSVLQGKEQISHLPLQLLFSADRGHHLWDGPEQIASRLQAGTWCVTARYALTTIAWGMAHGVSSLVTLAANIAYPWPNLNIVLMVPIEECVRRIEERGVAQELFEVEESMRKIAETFEFLAVTFPNVVLVDGTGTVPEVFERIKNVVGRRLLLILD